MARPVSGIVRSLATLGTSRVAHRHDPPLMSFEYRTDRGPDNEIDRNPATNNRIPVGISRSARRLGIVRAVTLINSALVQVPIVIGWLRPAVLLPVGCLTGLSTVQIEAIFVHELAHIRRHDYLVSVFQSIVEAVLFYHPAVWWVSKQIRREREDCCDDLAVKISGDPLAYAKALSFLEEQRGSLPAAALGANGGVLAMRIKRLLGYKEPPAYSWLTADDAVGGRCCRSCTMCWHICRRSNQPRRPNIPEEQFHRCAVSGLGR